MPELSNSTQHTEMRPRVLLTSTNRWPVVPRLVITLRQVGCNVGAVCDSLRHPVLKLRDVGPVFPYNGLEPIRSLKRAIHAFDPEFIIPCCDRSVQHLHDLYAMSNADPHEHKIAALIEHSLGSPNGYSVTTGRSRLLDVARSEGVLVPETAAIENEADLQRWNASSRLPWIMKADGTWGGQGVRVVKNAAEARHCFLEFSQRSGAFDLLQSLLLNRDRDWLYFDWRTSRRSMIAQSIIDGRPANCAVFCWKGEVLAGIAVEVIHSRGEIGPATVVQVVPGTEMLDAATKIARRLDMSGFFGLDFMIDKTKGLPYLIEMNPRCTPPCPLPLGEGHDLVLAMRTQLSGQSDTKDRLTITQSVINYFPQSERRDNLGNPTFDSSVYSDVPEGEPELIRELLHPRTARSVVGRVVDLVRGKQHQEIFAHPLPAGEKRHEREERSAKVLA